MKDIRNYFFFVCRSMKLSSSVFLRSMPAKRELNFLSLASLARVWEEATKVFSVEMDTETTGSELVVGGPESTAAAAAPSLGRAARAVGLALGAPSTKVWI